MNEKKLPWLWLEELDSTNEYAKQKRAEGNSLFIVAKRQRGGRGTKGRSFSSLEGGVYLSLLRFFEDFAAKDAFQITCGAAVAVCETLREYGLQPKIKWPNDIFVNGRKISGILIENVFSGSRVASSIVGVGININNPLPRELKEIATSVYLETGVEGAVEETARRLGERLLLPCDMEKYRAYLGFIGERVTLLLGEEALSATLLGVEEDGKLRVKTAEGERLLSSAEVTVRICGTY